MQHFNWNSYGSHSMVACQFISACVCVCVCVYIYLCTSVSVCIYLSVYMCISVFMCAWDIHSDNRRFSRTSKQISSTTTRQTIKNEIKIFELIVILLRKSK